MKIMGIDQSFTCSAYVIVDEQSNVLQFDTIKTFNDDGDKFDRIIIIGETIANVVKLERVDKVNIEGLAMGNIKGNVSRDLAGLQAVIISALIKMNIPYSIIPPKSVKKLATDNGKASKIEMLEAVPESIRELFINRNYKKSTGLYDLTDAYFIALSDLSVSSTHRI